MLPVYRCKVAQEKCKGTRHNLIFWLVAFSGFFSEVPVASKKGEIISEGIFLILLTNYFHEKFYMVS